MIEPRELPRELPRDAAELPALREQTVTVFKAGEGTRPDVRVVRWQGEPYVLKDYSLCSPWFRTAVGRLLVWRETSALTALAGVSGIPGLVARLGPLAFLMEYLPGTLPARKRPALIDDAFMQRLQRLVNSMHAAGVAHCDLRRSSNILVNDDGQPFIVDFVSCVHAGPRWNLLWRAVFRRFCEADRKALFKLKSRVAPDLLSSEEAGQLQHTRFERFFRAIGHGVRVLARVLLAQDKRQ